MTQPGVGAQSSRSETLVDLSLFRLLSISFGTKPKQTQQEECDSLSSAGRITAACVTACESSRQTNYPSLVRDTEWGTLLGENDRVKFDLMSSLDSRGKTETALHPPSSSDWVLEKHVSADVSSHLQGVTDLFTSTTNTGWHNTVTEYVSASWFSFPTIK